MIWQDVLMSAVQWAFAVALVPTVVAGGRVPLMTSVPTATGLAAISLATWTLGLYGSSVTALICAALWFIIALQEAFRV